jgi:hypothetical protein
LVKEKVCFRCKAKAFRRINREGFLQNVVLPRLGIFPWECVLCRRRVYFRNDGRKAHRPALG